MTTQHASEIEVLGEPGKEPVALVDPDPAWPDRFDSVRALLAEALGPVALRIDHVGSTAVPGIPAKPVIDIQVSVPDVEDESAYRPAIEKLGWPLRIREPEHRFFRPPAGTPRTVHVHVCQSQSRWERDHLLLRDYLRAHADRAAAYGDLKRQLERRLGRDRWDYTDAKSPFIAETLQAAESWAATTGWRPDSEARRV